VNNHVYTLFGDIALELYNKDVKRMRYTLEQ